ncbi:cobalamin-binding protein [Pseudomonas sp. NPDC096917]|uniref:cobalamin-binding protein n=1 Tax=Pseudomonas sp. NPDC096917 TaxID=3364483 RepID=UPI00383A355B
MRAWLAVLLLAVGLPCLAAPRVISLAPSLSEIVVELGATDLLVGRLDAGETSPELAGVASVGRYGQIEMERLLSLQPDLILLWPGSVGVAQREQLRRLNIPTYSAEPKSLDQLVDQVQALADALGRPQRGHALAEQLRQRLAQLREQYRRDKPLRVFYQVWDQPLYTIGGGQIISDALAVCGASNVFTDLKLPAPQVSIESVLQRNPEVIIAGTQGQLDAWKAWPQIDAVKHGRLLLLTDKGLERPSGQMLEATGKLCEQLKNTETP